MQRGMRLLLNKWMVRPNLNKTVGSNMQNNREMMCRNFSSQPYSIILGIETSCDDTGCGIVDSKRCILGEDCNTQLQKHLMYGGVIPSIAQRLHLQSITTVCENALKSAGLRIKDIDAIAVTVKPGLLLSLEVGLRFAKYLSKMGNKPIIPIDHMEAHALTARMCQNVDYPFLTLLVSGGHAILAIVARVDQFYLLGTALDNAPGEMLDKVARRLKLRNIPEFSKMAGGKAIEMAARKATDKTQFYFPDVMISSNCCNFSFSGIAQTFARHLEREEKEHKIEADMIIPSMYNLCAAVQWSTITHILQRTQRAMAFFKSTYNLYYPPLVVSGGVACNDMLGKALQVLCNEHKFTLVRTPPRFCNDNGVMIAWNGIERWNAKTGVLLDRDEIEKLSIVQKPTFGIDWRYKIKDSNIKCKWTRPKKTDLEMGPQEM